MPEENKNEKTVKSTARDTGYNKEILQQPTPF